MSRAGVPAQALLEPVELEDSETIVDVLEAKQFAARNREADEIVDGRTQVCHYYTGVADALAFALELVDEGGSP